MTDATNEAPEAGSFRAAVASVNWWQATASAALGGCGLLSGIVIAGVSFWLIGAKDFVQRAEVSEMIKKEGPYVEDKGVLKDKLQQNTDAITRLTNSVQEMAKEQARMAAILERDNRQAGK